MKFWAWFRRSRGRADDLPEELRDLAGRIAEDYRANGWSDAEARRHAALDIGGIPQTIERCRDVQWSSIWSDGWGDLRLGARALRRSPSFTGAAVATLSIGAAATAVVFALVYAVLLRPLPYPEVDRVLALTSSETYTNSAQTGEIFHYVRDRSRVLEFIAATGRGSGWNLVVRDRASYIRALPVSHAYFDVLGVQPLVGRAMSEAEDQANGPNAIVMSHRLARATFGDVMAAPGQVVQVGGRPTTVVGVMPPSFQSTVDVDAWTPLRATPQDQGVNFSVIGRLRRGPDMSQARAELESLRPGMLRDLGANDRFFSRRVEMLTWGPFQAVVTGDRRWTLELLGVAAGLVLLIACANIAGLYVARGVFRRRELSTRIALGASATRVIRQLSAESIILGLGASMLGVGLAYVARRVLLASFDQSLLDERAGVSDPRVLAVTVVLSITASVLAGIWPAWTAVRLAQRLGAWTPTVRRDDSGPGRTARRSFVLAQVAMATMLLVGAGVTVRLLMRMSDADLGFEPSGVLTAQMSLQGDETPNAEALSRFAGGLLDRLRALPGVESATLGSQVPVEPGLNVPILPTGLVRNPRSVDWRYVSTDYFETLRIPVLVGRSFNARDQRTGQPVAIVNAAFAREYFGSAERAIGQMTQLAPMVPDSPREIVGVVGDVRASSSAGRARGPALVAPPPPTLFVPTDQVPTLALEVAHRFFLVRWVVRVSRGGPAIEQAIQDAFRAQAPMMPVVRWQWMPDVIEESKGFSRALRTLLVVFAAFALLLAGVGLYGLAAYSVAMRTREFGIRRALGATAAVVVRSVFGEHVRLALVGVAVGLVCAAGLARLIGAFVVGVDALDGRVYAAVLLVVFAASGVAACLPSIRAVSVSPMVALREE